MKIKNKKLILLVIGMFAIIGLSVGATWAFFSYVYNGINNSINTGTIKFEATSESFNLINQFPTDISNAKEVANVSIMGSTTYENGIDFIVKAIDVNNKGADYGIYPTIDVITEEVSGVSYNYVYDEEVDGHLDSEDIIVSGKVDSGKGVQEMTKIVTITAFYDQAKYHITDNTLAEITLAGLKPDYVTENTNLIKTEIWNSMFNQVTRSVVPAYSFKIQVITAEVGRMEKIGADRQFKYVELGDGKIQISRYIGDDTDVVIPSTYDGYQVYSVGNINAGIDKAIRYNIFGSNNSTSNSTIKSVTLSEGIERIEVAAFNKCTGLDGNLILPSTLTYIGDIAFNGCTGLDGVLDIPDSVTSIGTAAFQQCSGFSGELSLSDNLKKIGDYAFYGNTNLSGNLTIPSSIETIGNYAFYNCTKLNGSLVIEEGVKSIGASAFANNTKITSLSLPTGLETIGKSAFSKCSGITGDLVIPDGVTTIGEQAFYQCKGFDGIISLPNTLLEIGAYAFSDCTNLHGDLTIPNSVIKIGKTAFQYCSNLDGTLTLSNNLVELGSTVFNHTPKLINETLTIPKSLKIIGTSETSTHVFYDFATKTLKEYKVETGNTSFQTIDGVLFNIDATRLIAYPPNKDGVTYEIPEGVTMIDEMAFSRVGSTHSTVTENSLKKIILPNSYVLSTSVPEDVFLNKDGNTLAVALYTMTGVEEIGIKDDNPNYKAEDGILYSKDGTTLWYVPTAKTGDIIILDGVTTIKNGAFFDGHRSQNVTIPASVTTIESSTLSDLKTMGSSKVTFAEGSIYEFKTNGTIGKK